jgi:predicted metal-dependent enzyme (double-stranded beta helix superfamily)
MDYVMKSMVLAALCLAPTFAQDAGPGNKPVIDNDRVTVWDVTWTKGQLNPAREHDLDAVVMWVTGPQAGKAFFSAKGRGLGVEAMLDGPAVGPRSLIIELKDHPVPPIENKTGYPLAFPRPHVKKLLENDRVIVWSYRWNPGEPTPMHFHDKDVVVVYLEDTALTSTTPDGAKTVNNYKAFDIRFNKRDRTHTELLDHGTGSAMMMELK